MINVTNSFLTLDQEARGCQGDTAKDDCLTREYLKMLKDKCGCLPLDKALSNDSICLTKEETDCCEMRSASYSSNCEM